MADALEVIGESREVELQVTDNQFVVEDAAAAIRGYAEEGVDLVIAHGSQYGAPLSEIAPDFPEVAFAWGTEDDTFGLDNVFAYTVRSDEGGYALGSMAAELSESGVIGVVGPIDVGDAALYVDGFAAGVAAQDPAITVNENWIESFSDVALAAEAATAHIGAGADVLTGSAQMVVGATGVAAEEGVPWFGTQSNQTSLGADIVVASQVYHWEVILEEMLALIEGGTLGGEVFTLTLENGGLVVEFNDGYELPDEVRTLGEETIAGLSDGSIETGV
jgi:basic membrane protein A